MQLFMAINCKEARYSNQGKKIEEKALKMLLSKLMRQLLYVSLGIPVSFFFIWGSLVHLCLCKRLQIGFSIGKVCAAQRAWCNGMERD